MQGDDPQNKKIISELTALIIGGAVGGSTGTIGGGASIALHGDKYNRQLHPFELEALKKLAKEEAYSPESALTEQQWYDKLLLQALRQVDSKYAAQLGADDPLAQVVLGRINISVTDEEGRTIQLFQGGDAFENHARYAEHIRYSTDDYDRALSSWVKERASKTPDASAALVMVLNAYRDGGRTESADSRLRVIDYLLSAKPEIVYAFEQAELAYQEANNRGDRVAAYALGRELKELKTVLNETLLSSLNKAKSDGILPPDLQDMNLRVLSDALSIDSIMQVWAEGNVGKAVASDGYNSYGSLPKGPQGVVTPEVPANSMAARIGLREDLASQAGIPRNMVEAPANIWGKSIDDIQQSFKMDGAKLKYVPPKRKSSGNAQVYEVEGGATGIKEVQYSPSTVDKPLKSVHVGEYYKITYIDGSKVKVVDPLTYRPKFHGPSRPIYDANTVYLNPQGQKVIFNPSTNAWVKK